MPIDTRKFNIHPAYSKSPLCRGCPLEHDGTGFAIPDGTGSLRVLILGEALGPNEAKDGLGFRPYAPAGSVLERAFRSCGFSRPQFVIFNIVNCLPPSMELSGTPYEIAAAQHCRVHLKKVIEQYRPKVILALGAVALRSLTGYAGKKQSIEHMRGFALYAPEFPDIPVVTSYHPSYIVRGAWNVYPVLCRDLRYAVSIARNGFNPMPVEYVEHGTVNDLKHLIQICSSNELSVRPAVLSADWETEGNPNAYEDEQLMQSLEELYGEAKANKKTKKARERLGTEQRVTQLNVSVKEGQSFVFQAEPELMQWAKVLLALDIPKVGHNAYSFDLEIGVYNDMPWGGVVDDTMLCLRGDTLVALWDGSWRRVEDVVNKKLKCKIVGMDDFGKPIKLSITGWHKSKVEGQRWIKIKTEATKNPIVCTPDHEIWTVENCWKTADAVCVGDHLRIPRFFNDELFAGMMLGDASIHRKSRMLHVNHCEKQAGYIAAKAEAFGLEVIPFGNNGHPGYYFNVSVSSKWRDKFYDGKRRKFIAPPSYAALAVWYQDDGCFSRNKRLDVAYGNGRVLLAINRFESQAQEVLKYFRNKFGDDVALVRKNKMIRISKESLRKFFQAVHKFVHPCMDYKLPEELKGKYVDWMKPSGFQTSRVISVSEAGRGKYAASQDVRYCLSVDHSTQRFFTMGGLVHNCFHHLYPDVPGRRGKMDAEGEDGSFANLQYCASFYGFDFPWKHLVDEQPEFYGAADSDACLRLYNRLIPDMQSVSHPETGITVWDSYCTLVADLWPILQGASKRGMPVNRVKILEFLNSVVNRQRALGTEIQRIIPRELLPTKQKAGLKKAPKDTTGYELREFSISSSDERCKCFRVRKKDVEKYMALDGAEISDKDGKFRAPDVKCDVCGTTGWVHYPDRVETRWCKLLAFNPNSPVQMKQYANFHHHKIPKNKDRKYAMDKWTLDQLVRTTRDPLYRSTIDYRQFEKMSAYAIGWMPKEDGRVHPEFSYFPSTGQISSFNPNAQNVMSVSKYGVLAIEFRNGVEAPDGYVIIEIDLKSFHAQTLGFEAKCPAYIRLAKLDVHSYVAGNMLKLPHFDYCLEWEDDELLTFLKWHRKNYTCPDGTPFQKVRDERAKVGVLAFGLGQMAGSLFTSNRDSFLPNWYLDKREKNESLYDTDHKRADKEGLKAAQLVHDALNERFPELRLYRENTPLVIKKQGGRAVSRYGCVRWFWDIQHWDGRKSEFVHGTDWEKAISFYVQNDGHGYLKYALLRAQALGYLEKYGFVNTVHDSIVFCCRTALRDECIVNMKEELTRPSEVLTFDDGSGLSVDAEAKAGPTWSDMKEIVI